MTPRQLTAAVVAPAARTSRAQASARALPVAPLLRGLVAVVAAIPIVAYLWVALHRIGYPYELDWMEGGSVELVARVVAGHSLYAPPSLAYVGWTYTPFYYWVAAAVAKVTGVGFLPLRLVSFTASLAAMATLAWIVIHETGSRIAGLLAAGLFAATFRISGDWFDIGRVDSLFLALTLLAIAWGWRARGIRGGIVLGVLAFLAFFTKQTALLALLPTLVYLALTRRRVGVPALLVLVGLVVASTAALDASSQGWYRYYVFTELAHQPWAESVWTGFWREDILGNQWPLVVLIAGGRLALARRAAVRTAVRTARASNARLALRAAPAYYALAAVGLICSAWLSRLHTGGYTNVLMPAFAAIALLAGLTYGAVLRARTRRVTHALMVALLVLQLSLLVYPLGAQIPGAADRAAGAQLIARLRALPGPVLVLRHPWYATLAGKGSFAHEEAIGDVLRATGTRGARALRASLPEALNRYHIQAVVLDGTYDAGWFGTELTQDFRLQAKPITSAKLNPPTDVHTAPTLLYVRVRPAS